MRTFPFICTLLVGLSAACSSPSSSNDDDDDDDVLPAQLSKSSWQIDLASLRGSYRLQAPINQSAGALSGAGRDNLREVDVVTSGTITGNTATVKFVLTNGGSPRGEFTCTALISGSQQSSSQTAFGTFTTPAANMLFGGASGSLGPASTECRMT